MTTETDTRRYAYQIAPEPDIDTGTRLEWARYHLTRAQAWLTAHWEVGYGEDTQPQRWYTLERALDDGRAGLLFLLADGTDTGARRVMAEIGDGDGLGEWVWQHLTEFGIDPASVRPFGLRSLPRIAACGEAPSLTEPTPADLAAGMVE